MSFVISSIKTVEAIEIELKHPETGDPLGAFVSIMGPEHPKRKQAVFKAQRAFQKQFNKHGKITKDPEEAYDEATDELISITVGWRGFKNEDDTEFKFTPENVRKIYSETELAWIRNQIIAAKDDAERFTTSSVNS